MSGTGAIFPEAAWIDAHLPRRARILLYAALNRSTGGGWGPLLVQALGPTSGWLARRRLLREVREEGAWKVAFRGVDETLHLPEDYPPAMLWMIATEQFHPWHWHQYEIPQTRVRPDDVVLDCGAAEGLFALRVHGRCARVVCFEPVPLYLRFLQRTFAGVGNVSLAAAALGAEPGQAFLYENGAASFVTSRPNGHPVPVTTVDAYCAEHGLAPGFLKGDLEGSERAVLLGAEQVIRRHRPRIALTTYHRPGDAQSLRALLAEWVPEYRFLVKGIHDRRGGEPVMLHAWVDDGRAPT
ncbi:MAG: FkbM family methyltransferase [Magnetococcales bacterium]|nr:FkbM family methyltransferase [Magnetococcales bacterium]